MGIHAIIGNPKKGKTLLMTGLWAYSNYDEYYTNIDLKGHDFNKLESFEDIINIPKNGKSKGIFIDELQQMGADSWDYGALADVVSKLGTQHRKYHATFYFTTQMLGQIVNRIRNIRDSLMQPVNIAFGSNGKPLAVDVLILEDDIYGNVRLRDRKWFPLIKDGEYVCDLYDTYEFVDQMEAYSVTMTRKMLKQYKDFNLWTEDKKGLPKEDAFLKRVLKSKMVLEDSISKTLAGDIINTLSARQAKNLVT